VLLLGGIIGAFLIGYGMDRFGVFRVLLPVHIAAAALIAMFGLSVATAPVVLAFLIGMTLNGGTSGVQGLLARLYPTPLRTTGIGWASGVSRFVGIGQPLLTGLMLGALWSPATTLLACAVPLLIASFALVLLSRDPNGAAAAAITP
jgi:AAHS family 4-hydroxybenzoate transporter-like MFS transporter